jgi:hypothetical protein
MVFSEDSYNKKLPADAHSSVLVGNWFEESVLKATVGEARSVPQRHIKRAGLLKDFTKRPSELRQLDNTFERVCGSGTIGQVEGRFVSTNKAAFAQETRPREQEQGPRRAREEAKFLAKAKKTIESNQNKTLDERSSHFETEYKAAMKVEITGEGRAKKEKVDVRPVKWLGKHTEFTNPIEHQMRGGRFKDESGIRPSH